MRESLSLSMPKLRRFLRRMGLAVSGRPAPKQEPKLTFQEQAAIWHAAPPEAGYPKGRWRREQIRRLREGLPLQPYPRSPHQRQSLGYVEAIESRLRNDYFGGTAGSL